MSPNSQVALPLIDGSIGRLDNPPTMVPKRWYGLGFRLAPFVGLAVFVWLSGKYELVSRDERNTVGRFQRYAGANGRTMRLDTSTGATCVLERSAEESFMIQSMMFRPDGTTQIMGPLISQLEECEAHDNPSLKKQLQNDVEAERIRLSADTRK